MDQTGVPPQEPQEREYSQDSENTLASPSSSGPVYSTPGRQQIADLFNREFKVILLDDRVIVGTFLCTDHDQNIILGGAKEYENEHDFAANAVEPRLIGLAMVNGKNLKGLFVESASS
ncbi:N-alpha-acetyltransferase 38, NatC auxiliary subunit-like [Paramacrobiotus metropolitanus]|uniref:N-alpha-acetyltransferase 38, NatC auxiliary subunit-like n=1 Tax=Paramacrobiotus metropolitanus TaxID=2943436 RepID=UPI0024463CD8|nr:N-alpha-acetyltransferase 38, NatC auxiliary subunit-like [Paramacrobiotus metropolitanus]